MYIEEFGIRNVRVHEELRLQLAPVTVLLGPNNSGKSTVLDALYTLSRFSSGEYSQPRTGKYSFGAMLRHGCDSGDGVTLSAILSRKRTDTQKLSWEFSYRAESGAATITSEELVRLPEGTLIYKRDDANVGTMTPAARAYINASTTAFGALRRAYRDGYREQDPLLLSIARSIGAFGKYRLNPVWVARPGPLPDEDEGGRVLIPSPGSTGERLTSVLATLERDEPSAFELIASDLRLAVPGFDCIEFNIGEQPGEVEFAVRFKDARSVVPANQLSDGTLSLIGYVTIFRSPRQWRVLLIEEPELGLTPTSVRALCGAMLGGAPTSDGEQAQVVLSTHSPFLVHELLRTRMDDVKLIWIGGASSGATEARDFEELFEEFHGELATVGPERIAALMGTYL